MTEIDFTGSSGIGFITNELASSGDGNLESMLAIADHESDVFQFTDSTVFLPKSSLFVTMNVYITGLSAVDGISLTSFTQRFAQTGPPSHTGDFNDDGVVDAGDLTVWQGAFGTGAADADNDGDSDGADFLAWQQQLGSGLPATAAAAAVPEPASLTLISLAGIGLALVLQQRR